MFFIGIFGVESKQRKIKYLEEICCKNCSEKSGGTVIKTFNFFHLFFIPLFKWNEKYYVICNGCNSTYELSDDKGKNIEKNEDIEITYWDLNLIEENKNGYNNLQENICEHCGKRVDSNFKYCPYCGQKTR